MKKAIFITVLLVSLFAWAGFEASFMFQEYQQRASTKFSDFDQKVLFSLYKQKVQKSDIVSFKADETANTFSFHNLADEICSGTYDVTAKSSQYSCVPRWTPGEAKMLKAIEHGVNEKGIEIVDLEIYEDTRKFLFQTANKELCHGEIVFGVAQFKCFSKGGIMTIFAAGDSD